MIALVEQQGTAELADRRDLPERAVEMAAALLREAKRFETGATRARARRLARMMKDESGKRFTIRLADEVLRVRRARRAGRRMRDLLKLLGGPRCFEPWERWLLRAGAWGARVAPELSVPLLAERVRRESRGVILSAEPGELRRYLAKRRSEGMRVNLNVLGEAVLGEGEAENRLAGVLAQLAAPEVDYVSVKLSAVFSQIHLVGYEDTLVQVKKKLRRIYRGAMGQGGPKPKFVNLDMEEYRDMALTIRAFCEVLDEPEFAGMEAGVVLQAYLPDSFAVQQELTAWARRRLERTGTGIKLRLVKGANLAMEQVEAAQRGWMQAPYESKLETDANFKRMLRFACEPGNAAAVRVGVGSHNLFDVAYALLLSAELGVEDRVEFEMLEGMAQPHAAAVRNRAGGLLLYAPVVRKEHFPSAIAYLVRRLDENTAAANFLADLFDLEVGGEAWERQRLRFLEACARSGDASLASAPRRTQNRLLEEVRESGEGNDFRNEPDTDFALEANREWVEAALRHWERVTGVVVPLQVGGRERAGVDWGRGYDPSFADREVYRFALGGPGEVLEAVQAAREAQPAWEAWGVEGRAEILRRAAGVIRKHRGDTIGCMVMDAGKAVLEADAEVSEAVDFARAYAGAWESPGWVDGVRARAWGTVLVTPPWNFPYAIPAGGCLAALMAGNAVILKPAPETVLTAWKLATHLWEAGVPREVLQFLPVADGDTGRQLVTSDGVDAVILTGAYETARLFRSWKPGLRLLGETSGKNAVTITQAADLDLAIKDLVKSAFGHAGQKCSAASLALLEGPVYDDERFREALRDAVLSLRVGSAWDRSAVVTPLIREPGKELARALRELDEGEAWLVAPRQVGENPRLWSPGVKWGVRRGSWFARTECFGPVLGLMRVRDLEEALEVLDESELGLTSGICSLDEGEISRWTERVRVGNGYVNRGITGALVRRQPFGGWKRSAVGPGAKAGGPNYVAGLVRWEASGRPRERAPLDAAASEWLRALSCIWPDAEAVVAWERAAQSDALWWEREFGVEHDPCGVRGESNVFRYVPWERMGVRVEWEAGLREEAGAWQLGRVMLAARCCGVPLEVSLDRPWPLLLRMAGLAEKVTVEASAAMGRRIEVLPPAWRWLGGSVPCAVRRALNDAHTAVHEGPVLENGRIELLAFFREQSMARVCHRYGNLVVPG